MLQFSKICGKLNLDKCKSLNIPVNKYSLLKNDESIIIDNILIQSQDVMDISDGPIVFIIDSDITNIDHFIGAIGDLNISNFIMFHISDYNIICHQNYLKLFHLFPHSKHFIITPDTCSIHPYELYPRFFAAYKELYKLSPSLFVEINKPNNKLFMYPEMILKNLSSIDIKTGQIINDKNKIIESDIDLNNEICCKKSKLNDDTYYPYILFLGTASTSPSRYRNVSSLLVVFNQSQYALLDCGESTLNQLYHMYSDELESFLINLKFIFISHIHADHHLGLISLIKSINQCGNRKIIVICPEAIIKFLSFYNTIDQIYYESFNFNQCNNLLITDSNINVTTFPVNHTVQAYGIKFQYMDKIVIYSGDTRPCDQIIQYGQNCDFFIHEATFDQKHLDEALKRKHATVKEAIELGIKANAKLIILTHFSLRYPHFENIQTDNLNNNIIYAFDFMKINNQNYINSKQFKNVLTKLCDE